MLLIDDDDNEDNDDIQDGRTRTKHLHLKHADEITATKMIAGAHLAAPKQMARILMEPDFRLIEALIHSQQNFVLSDPSLPDNPIVYCSDGFCNLTGYKRQFILGRNCRFLQGPGTDQAAVDIIRKGVLEGCDISVCLVSGLRHIFFTELHYRSCHTISRSMNVCPSSFLSFSLSHSHTTFISIFISLSHSLSLFLSHPNFIHPTS